MEMTTKQNTLETNQWVKEEIVREIVNTFRWMRIDTRYQNLWDAAKAVPRGKFTGVKCLYEKKVKSLI